MAKNISDLLFLEKDNENMRRVSENTYLLCLPDGCDSVRWEAAQFFADAAATLKKWHPSKKFRLIPFNYSSDGALKVLLAIAE